MKSAVVTGASGFCGRAMIRFLSEKGISTVALNRSNFYDPSRKQAGPDVNTVAESLARAKPDVIFHLVGTSHSPHVSDLYEANFLSTLTLFEALRKLRLTPCVVLCGSAAEYGRINQTDLPLSENYEARPVDAYGASKLAQTNLGLLAAESGFKVIISRPFNIIGSEMPTRLALGSFLDQLAGSLPLGKCTIQAGNVHTSRDFVTVEDAVRAWWDLSQTPAALNQIVNICSGTPIKISGLLEYIKKTSPIPVEIVSDAKVARPNDIPVHYGDNSRLLQLVGWVPKPPGEDMIRDIVNRRLAFTSCAPSS